MSLWTEVSAKKVNVTLANTASARAWEPSHRITKNGHFGGASSTNNKILDCERKLAVLSEEPCEQGENMPQLHTVRAGSEPRPWSYQATVLPRCKIFQNKFSLWYDGTPCQMTHANCAMKCLFILYVFLSNSYSLLTVKLQFTQRLMNNYCQHYDQLNTNTIIMTEYLFLFISFLLKLAHDEFIKDICFSSCHL